MPPPNHHPPQPPTKIRSLKLQFRPPGSQPPSPAATPPPASLPVNAVASSSKPTKDKQPLKKKNKKTTTSTTTYKKHRTPKAAPAPTLLTAGTSSRPQVHQIVRKPPAVFPAQQTAGFDDDGNSTLSELSSAEESGAEAAAAGAGGGGADDDDLMEEEEPRWDEEFNGAWERRRGSFPSDDDRAGRSDGEHDETSSAFDDDMDDDDDDSDGGGGGGGGLSGSENSDGIRVLTFDSQGARVLLGAAGLQHAGGWSDDSSEGDDDEEELWFEDYAEMTDMDMDVDGADDGASPFAPAPSNALLQPGMYDESNLPSADPSVHASPHSTLDQQHPPPPLSALDFLDAEAAAGAVYEDFQAQDPLHMLEDMDGELIFSALADALGNLGAADQGAGNVFQWATESEGDSDGSKDAARMDDLWDESTDEDHYFGDEEGDTTDSLPEDEVDEAIKRSLLEEDGAPTPPSVALSASLVRQIANGSDARSTPALISPALVSAVPVPLPPSAAPSPMEIIDLSPPPIPQLSSALSTAPVAAAVPSGSRSPSIVSEAATVSSAGHPSRPRPGSDPLASVRKTPSAKPAMGCFIPAPTPAHFKSVIIDGAEDRNGAAPPTPFARRKAAEKSSSRSRDRSLSLKTGSTGRKHDRFNKVKYPFVPKTKRTRYGSSPSSRHASPRPPLPLREDTPSSPDVEPVSLEDVLDPSLFHHGFPSSTSDPSLHATSLGGGGGAGGGGGRGSTDRERHLADHSSRNLQRWDRVSIGTFRGRLGGGGAPSRGAFSSSGAQAAAAARPPLVHSGSSGGNGSGSGSGRPSRQAYDHSPSKTSSIFRTESAGELDVPPVAAQARTTLISPVIQPKGADGQPLPSKGKDRELEGFVL